MRPADAVLIGEARKSRSHVVKIFLGNYDGMPFVYLSVFGKEVGETDEQAVDLQRGVTLSPTCWADLLPIIESAVSRASEEKQPDAVPEDECRMKWDRAERREGRRRGRPGKGLEDGGL